MDKVVSEALRLPPQARAFIAEKLIESLDAEPGEKLSPAWIEAIRRRCREVDDGAVELRAAEEVFAKAYLALEGDGYQFRSEAPCRDLFCPFGAPSC
ncbi:MAG: addiction module protein [Planctomycetes bacterium]|nr:addiction module protein [Planctomycetota bacterium]